MAKLRTVVTREIKPGATPPRDNRAAQHAMLLSRLQTDIDHQRWQDAASQLNFFAEQERSVEMLQLIHELRLEILKQIDARENAAIARIEATIKSASQICSNARNPGEIDDIFRELTDIRPPEGLQKERVRGAVEKLNGAIQFVARWQDSLAKEIAGKHREATAVVEALLQDGKLYPVVDRSQVVARLNKLGAGAPPETARTETAADVVRKTKSIDEIAELHTILERQFGQHSDKSSAAMIQEVSMLRTAYIDYRSALYGSAFQRCLDLGGKISPEIVPLQQQLLVKLMPYYLNMDAGTDAPSTNVWDYLVAVLNRAKENKDWRLALHALETQRLIAFRTGPPAPWLVADIEGYSHLVAAVNAEAAGLSAQMLASYEKALASSGQNLPVSWIAERVKTFRGLKADANPRARRPR